MKKTTVVLLLAAFVGACGEETVAPSETTDLLEMEAILAFDAGGVSAPGGHLVGIHRLPRELQPTAEQEAQIKALLERFQAATQADREKLARIFRQAEEARRTGSSREEVAAILAQANEVRRRMAAAEQQLAAAILNLLTAEQKAWLEANQPTRCNTRTAPQLTEAQRSQIAALLAAYEENNKADLETLKNALERARQAQRNGASREEIAQILQSARDAAARLHAAQAELAAAIDALLTPEQKASGCFRNSPLRRSR
jgi:Spy/CpxP family protein refolding chaperone